MELWWRTAALQALAACVQGPLAQAFRSAQASLHKRAVALLKPTLDVLTAHAALQVGVDARWCGHEGHNWLCCNGLRGLCQLQLMPADCGWVTSVKCQLALLPKSG